jgi:hypothetical protein
MSNSADFAIGCLGVDLDRTDVSAQHDRGLEVPTRDGAAVYARAAAATPEGSLCGIAPSSAGISASAAVATLTSTGNAQNFQIFGVSNTSVAVSSFGWFYTSMRNPRGAQIRGATAIQPNIPVYTTGTGGVVDDATASLGLLLGLRVLESAASASTVPCVFHDILVGQTREIA